MIAELVEILRPVLTEYGEVAAVESTVSDILNSGTGARRQREAYSNRHELSEVMPPALDATHRGGPVPSPAS